MQGTIFLTTYGIVSLVVIVLFSRYVLPAITAVFTGTGRAPPRHLHPHPASRRHRPQSLKPRSPLNEVISTEADGFLSAQWRDPRIFLAVATTAPGQRLSHHDKPPGLLRL